MVEAKARERIPFDIPAKAKTSVPWSVSRQLLAEGRAFHKFPLFARKADVPSGPRKKPVPSSLTTAITEDDISSKRFVAKVASEASSRRGSQLRTICNLIANRQYRSSPTNYGRAVRRFHLQAARACA